MNKNKQIFELYIDYLVTSLSYTTATGLSNLLDGELSHDQITRFLSKRQFTSANLWRNVKKEVRQIESDDLTLILITRLKLHHYETKKERATQLKMKSQSPCSKHVRKSTEVLFCIR